MDRKNALFCIINSYFSVSSDEQFNVARIILQRLVKVALDAESKAQALLAEVNHVARVEDVLLDE